MDIKELESKKLSDLRVIAQTLGIENAESLKKSEIINQLNQMSKQSDPSETSSQEEAKTVSRVRKTVINKNDTEEIQTSTTIDDTTSKEDVENQVQKRGRRKITEDSKVETTENTSEEKTIIEIITKKIDHNVLNTNITTKIQIKRTIQINKLQNLKKRKKKFVTI